MNGCCYSCKLWTSAKIKQAIFDVKRVISDEEIVVEVRGKEIRMRSWNYSIPAFVKELINGIKEGSVRYCNGRLIKPWDFCDKFEPRILNKERDISSGEEYESAYLTCWAEGDAHSRSNVIKSSSILILDNQGFISAENYAPLHSPSTVCYKNLPLRLCTVQPLNSLETF